MTEIWRRGPLRARTVVGVLVIALVAAFVWQGLVWRSDRAGEDRRRAAVEIARAQVTDLLNFDKDTVDDKLDSLADRSSASFADEVRSFAEAFASSVESGGVTTEGEVTAVGVGSISDEEASVLVYAAARVSAQGQTEIPSSYRMRLHLVRRGAGWAVDGMEFVQ